MDRREGTVNQRPMSGEEARAAHEALLGGVDGVVAIALRLHAPDEQWGGASCSGCDYSGWEAEPPLWPCRTVRAIRDASGGQ